MLFLNLDLKFINYLKITHFLPTQTLVLLVRLANQFSRHQKKARSQLRKRAFWSFLMLDDICTFSDGFQHHERSVLNYSLTSQETVTENWSPNKTGYSPFTSDDEVILI